MRLPLALVGWDTEQQTMKLPLFTKFRERPDMPFCEFRAALQVSPSPLSAVAVLLHHRKSRQSGLITPAGLEVRSGHPLYRQLPCMTERTLACRRMQGAGSGQGCTAQLRMWILTWDTSGGLSTGYMFIQRTPRVCDIMPCAGMPSCSHGMCLKTLVSPAFID